MNLRRGLQYIVFYDRHIGNTYFGWNFGQKLSALKMFALIVWNLIFLSMVFIHLLLGLMFTFITPESDYSNRTRGPESSNTNTVLLILYQVGCVSYITQTTIISLFVLIRGQNILNILNKKEIIKIQSNFEKKIGLVLVSIKFFFQLYGTIMIWFILYPTYNFVNLESTLYFIYLIIVFIMEGNTLFVVFMLILYKSLLIRRQFKELSKLKDLNIIFDMVCKFREITKKLSTVLSLFNLIILMMNVVICASGLCMLVIVPSINPFQKASQFLSSAFLIIFQILVCDVVPKSYDLFLGKLKDRYKEFNENKTSSEQQLNHILMIRLNEMKDEMCFTAFNLFKLNANTLLSCLALIISYSIVIIQTAPTSINCPRS